MGALAGLFAGNRRLEKGCCWSFCGRHVIVIIIVT
jgi:hypothetical protein